MVGERTNRSRERKRKVSELAKRGRDTSCELLTHAACHRCGAILRIRRDDDAEDDGEELGDEDAQRARADDDLPVLHLTHCAPRALQAREQLRLPRRRERTHGFIDV